MVKIFSVRSTSTSVPVRWPSSRTSTVKNAVRSLHPRGLLHVVGDDDDRVVGHQLLHQLLDLRAWRSDRAPSTARPSGSRPARPRWPGRCTGAAAGRRTGPCAESSSLSLTSSHSAARRRDLLHQLVHVPLVAGDPRTERHVVVDRLGNGFGFWNTMPILRRTSTGSTASSYRSTPWYSTSPRPGPRR